MAGSECLHKLNNHNVMILCGGSDLFVILKELYKCSKVKRDCRFVGKCPGNGSERIYLWYEELTRTPWTGCPRFDYLVKFELCWCQPCLHFRICLLLPKALFITHIWLSFNWDAARATKGQLGYSGSVVGLQNRYSVLEAFKVCTLFKSHPARTEASSPATIGSNSIPQLKKNW